MKQETQTSSPGGDKQPRNSATDRPSPEELLGMGKSGSGRRGRRLLVPGIVLLLVAGAAWYFLLRPAESRGTRWETAVVERGDLTVTVSATGTLEPINQVDVGSELSGTIETVLVDDNSRVEKGQVLARLDVSKLEDQIANSRAALQVAEASVLEAEATRAEAMATLNRQREVFKLSGGKVPSKTELETAEATLARAEAALASAKASVAQARATLRTNETNLEKAIIRSPINGVVLSREVEPGQTVAASYQAPVLFTLAEDLARMELQVDVDEADVGQVREGQHAEFTVDAYPNRKYPAVITRVRYGATTTDNVVTYLTVLQVDNDDLSLRPGMTASAEITTNALHDVILVPNAALRFTPPSNATQSKQSLIASLMPRPPRQQKNVRVVADKNGRRQLWVLQDGQAVAIEVTTGSTDGRVTEIVAGDLQPGMTVITGTLASAQ